MVRRKKMFKNNEVVISIY